jgi:hypothetical protein
MKILLLCILFLSLFLGINADDFKWKTLIDSVPTNNFYKIQLSPSIISGAKSDFSDFRIFDSKHNEVPYLFVSENHVTEKNKFIPYPILENHYLPKQAITRIVIHNQGKSIISSFVFQIRNTEIEKEITLKGSDNQKDWFIIKRNYPVSSSNLADKTSELRMIDFPKSNYEFFEITLNDKRKDPLQILAVGNYDSESNQGLYSEISTPVIHQSDSSKLKKSFITLSFNEIYEIDRLVLQIKGPDYYMRNCTIGTYQIRNGKKIYESLNSFVIASGSSCIWNFNDLKAKQLVIEIENADNTPLQVSDVKAFQLSKYLIARLNTGEKYVLFLGNEKISSPNYDLQYFTDKIPKDIQILKTGSKILLPQSSNPVLSAFFTKTYIWIALLAIIALLSWLSIKMVREMHADKAA